MLEIHKDLLQVFFYLLIILLGITLIDFIVLPARSRISVVFAGETRKNEGFICLKR